jgi:hypothetical protein
MALEQPLTKDKVAVVVVVVAVLHLHPVLLTAVVQVMLLRVLVKAVSAQFALSGPEPPVASHQRTRGISNA